MDYVTVVKVDNGENNEQQKRRSVLSTFNKKPIINENPSFITVLSINECASRLNSNSNIADTTLDVESVLVYRLPGERLGFGLKFQGGTKSNEKIQRLFIQSCAADSPASRTQASWGNLKEGDEIISIDGQSISEMTRIECVRCLKESNVAIKLVIRNGHGAKIDICEEDKMKCNQQPPPPPPVPPRKLTRRRQQQENMIIKDDKPFTPPPDAEYYINLFSDENSVIGESESDDTGSSISTVIDKFSISSTYSSDSDISTTFSASGGGTNNGVCNVNKIELVNVIKPFTLLEKEFNIDSHTKLEECLKKLDTTEAHNESENIKEEIKTSNQYENVVMQIKNVEKNVEIITAPQQQHQRQKNCYENVLIRPQMNKSNYENVEIINASTTRATGSIPTPKPRAPVAVEPKKRSIMPIPRKIKDNKDDRSDKINISNLNEDNFLQKPNFGKQQDLITKIPKAIASVFSSPRIFERSKTESELKYETKLDDKEKYIKSISTQNLKEKCKLFIQSGINNSSENLSMNNQYHHESIDSSYESKSVKSKIPIMSPRKLINSSSNNTNNSNDNIIVSEKSIVLKPRILVQKQKSESDLKLNFDRTKFKEQQKPQQQYKENNEKEYKQSNLPVINNKPQNLLKSELNSGESIEYSDEKLIKTDENYEINSLKRNTIKEKPKPPERKESLQKSPAPKSLKSMVNDKNLLNPSLMNNLDIPSKAELKKETLTNEKLINECTTAAATKRVEIIKLNISSTTVTKTNTKIPSKICLKYFNCNEDDKNKNVQEKEENENLPRLVNLVPKSVKSLSSSFIKVENNGNQIKSNKNENFSDVDDNNEPIIIKKCIKIDADNNNYDDNIDTSSSDESDGNGRIYEIEDGEKLGPPEVINDPGPSEAYFNFHWHSNMLPTIGEVEEEFSSLEQQAPSRPIVVINDYIIGNQNQICDDNHNFQLLNEKSKEVLEPKVRKIENELCKSKLNGNQNNDLISKNCKNVKDKNKQKHQQQQQQISTLFSTSKDNTGKTQKISSSFSDKIIITEVEGDSTNATVKMNTKNLQIVSNMRNVIVDSAICVNELKMKVKKNENQNNVDENLKKNSREISQNDDNEESNLITGENNNIIKNSQNKNITIKDKVIIDNNKNNCALKATNSIVKICETHETVITKSDANEENEETIVTNSDNEINRSVELSINKNSMCEISKEFDNKQFKNIPFSFDENHISMNFPFIIEATKEFLISEKCLSAKKIPEEMKKKKNTKLDSRKEITSSSLSLSSSCSSSSYSSSDSEKPIRPSRKSNKRKQSFKGTIKNENKNCENSQHQQKNQQKQQIIENETTTNNISSDINKNNLNLNSVQTDIIQKEILNSCENKDDKVVRKHNSTSNEKNSICGSDRNTASSNDTTIRIKDKINSSPVKDTLTVKVVKVLPKVESDLTALKRSLEMDLNQANEDSSIDISKDFIISSQKKLSIEALTLLPLLSSSSSKKLSSKINSKNDNDDQLDASSLQKQHLKSLSSPSIYNQNSNEVKSSSMIKPIERIILGVEHQQKTSSPLTTTLMSDGNAIKIDANNENNNPLDAEGNTEMYSKPMQLNNVDDGNDKDVNKD